MSTPSFGIKSFPILAYIRDKFGNVKIFTYIASMKNLNIKEAATLHGQLAKFGQTKLSLVEFLQEYIDQYKDDWYMYRPVVRKLEQTVIDLEIRVKQLEEHPVT
jgi:hypothetical protein